MNKDITGFLIIAERLSYHYSKKYPDISHDEFYSIALVAVAEALKSYKPNKGNLKNWVKQYIYMRFKNYITRQYIPQKILKNRIKQAFLCISNKVERDYKE